MLQEKIMSLNRKVERHDQLRADLASTQTKTLQLNQQIQDWNQMAASVLPDANGPKSVADAVKRLQREQLLLTAKSGTLICLAAFACVNLLLTFISSFHRDC